jgi:hypothetical protein
MQLNPTLASPHTAPLRAAAPPDQRKNQNLHIRTQQLPDSKELINELAPQDTSKNAYKSLKIGPNNPALRPKNSGPTHSAAAAKKAPAKESLNYRTTPGDPNFSAIYLFCPRYIAFTPAEKLYSQSLQQNSPLGPRTATPPTVN